MIINIKNVKLKLALEERSERTLLAIQGFKIEAGQKILINGPSGAGKSSLLHLIAGLLDASEGSIYWNEKLVSDLSDNERSQTRKKKFAIIFQRLNLLDHLSLKENIFLALDSSLSSKEKNDRAEEALESVGLKKRADDLAAVMSLGEQQRLAIARALAQRPEIILADEPTSSLDQKNADICLQALFKASTSASLVVVSHDERIQKNFSRLQSILDWVP